MECRQVPVISYKFDKLDGQHYFVTCRFSTNTKLTDFREMFFVILYVRTVSTSVVARLQRDKSGPASIV